MRQAAGAGGNTSSSSTWNPNDLSRVTSALRVVVVSLVQNRTGKPEDFNLAQSSEECTDIIIAILGKVLGQQRARSTSGVACQKAASIRKSAMCIIPHHFHGFTITKQKTDCYMKNGKGSCFVLFTSLV